MPPTIDQEPLEASDLHVGDAHPRTSQEKALCAIWGSVLQIPEPGIDDNYFEVGGDSIHALSVASHAVAVGIRFKASDLFRHQTIRELCSFLEHPSSAAVHEQGEVVGELPLTPVQRRVLALPSTVAPRTQSAILHVDDDVRLELLQESMEALVRHHDILRTHVHNVTTDPHAVVRSFREMDVDWTVPLVEVPPGTDSRAVIARLTRLIDTTRGVLVAAAVLRGGGRAPDRVVVTIDHVAVDLVSWRILADDVLDAYEQVKAGELTGLPAKTTSFRRWMEHIAEFGASDAALDELPYWTDVLAGPSAPTRLHPLSASDADETSAGHVVRVAERFTRALPAPLTARLLQQSPLVRPDAAVLAAVAKAHVSDGGDRLVVDVESHGRHEFEDAVDVSRTVGCFTAIYPTVVELPLGASFEGIVERVSTELQSVPSTGVGFDVLRARGLLVDAPSRDICFNHLGRLDQAGSLPLLLSSRETLERPEPRLVDYLLEVTSGVVDGELVVDFAYAASLEREEVSSLADGTMSFLTGLLSDDATGDVVETYAATSLQQALVFQTIMSPSTGMCHAQATLGLDGDLDVDRLRASIETVVARHAVLRTTFQWEDEPEPLQVVNRDLSAPFAFLDLSTPDGDTAETAWAARARDDRLADFDLGAGPLLRFTCARMGSHTYRLLTTVHHALLDGWSISLLLSEIVQSYRSLAAGKEPALSESPPFRRYVESLAALDMREAREVWLDELRGASGNRISDTWSSYWGKTRADAGECHRFLDEASTVALRRFCATNRLTPNAVLQSVWAVVLSHVYASQDVVFGVVCSTRGPQLEGSEDTLGLLVETIPARVTLDPTKAILEWLHQEQEHQVGLREYAFASLPRICSWLGLAPDGELFDTLFVYRNFPGDLRSGTDANSSLAARVLDAPVTRLNGYALTVSPQPSPELDLAVFYERDHVDDVLARRMTDLYAELILTVIADGRAAVSSLLGQPFETASPSAEVPPALSTICR